MDVERRRRLTPDERMAQLVALGVEFLAEHPLHELTVEELSARAGVSRGLLFHYFDSKQGLHREVVRTARDSMLHATQPAPDLPPAERLRDTLMRTVEFVRDHKGTFYSLVRGVASGDSHVRDVIDQARVSQSDRVTAVFLELGAPDALLLRIALRSWVAFAEEVLVDSAVGTQMRSGDIAGFLERSAYAVVASIDAGESRIG